MKYGGTQAPPFKVEQPNNFFMIDYILLLVIMGYRINNKIVYK